MFSLGNSLLVKPGRIWEDCLYVWILRTSLRKMLPSPGRSPRVHSEVQEGDEAERWVSFDLLHGLALSLALPGASVVDASWWLPQLLCQSRRGMEEGLVVSAEIFPVLGSPRKDHF